MLCGDEIDYTPTQWPPLNSRGSFYTFSGSNGAGTLILLAYQDVRNQSQQNLDVDDGISCCPADFASQIGEAINCLDVTSSRCDVWCVTRDCVTGRWRDWGSWYPGVTQETGVKERGSLCASDLMPVTMVTCSLPHNDQFYCLGCCIRE